MKKEDIDGIEAVAASLDNAKIPTENRYFFCIYCNRAIEIKENVIVHDDVYHPIDYVFDPIE